MFRSATLKLTAWYLAILMTISIVFSIVIFQLNFHEVGVRLENLQQGLISAESLQQISLSQVGESALIRIQAEQAALQMFLSLIYINAAILIAGGVGSYFLARRTLQPIERAHDAQSRFTSDASHELRTPLASMKTELEVALRDKSLSAEESRELLISNLEEVNKLIGLSEMLLKLSKLDYDRLERKQIDLVELFHSKLKAFPKVAKRFTVTTRKRATVFGNEAAIAELITILIDNAIKYSPPKSRIMVRIYERRLMGVFEISNSGPAISADRLPHIFERFYRADDSRTESDKKGYGLGLAIAKKIVDIHHGDLTVKSNDKLTTFTFSLPTVRGITSTVSDPSLQVKA
ncbi:MAG: ATP-binding protein [Candidatus Microsaccharimonas sp.]